GELGDSREAATTPIAPTYPRRFPWEHTPVISPARTGPAVTRTTGGTAGASELLLAQACGTQHRVRVCFLYGGAWRISREPQAARQKARRPETLPSRFFVSRRQRLGAPSICGRRRGSVITDGPI